MSSKQQTGLKRAEQIQLGDVVRVAVNGTEGEWAVVATEVSEHGEHAIELAQGTVIIAEAWDLLQVVDATVEAADDEHAHAWITIRDEDGDPIYGECVERGCTARERVLAEVAR